MTLAFNLPPALIIGLIVSVVLPLIVGLVTSSKISSSAKAVILAALAAVTGFGTELLASINAGTTYDAGNGLVLAVTSFLIAVGLHFGLWKPTGASATLQAVGAGTKDDPAVITSLGNADAVARAQGRVTEGDPTPAVEGYSPKHTNLGD